MNFTDDKLANVLINIVAVVTVITVLMDFFWWRP